MSGLFGAMQADDVKARDDRNWRHQLAREKRADAIADAKEKRDNQIFDLNVKLQNNKISAAEADAERKRVEAEYADDLAKARLKLKELKRALQKLLLPHPMLELGIITVVVVAAIRKG